MDTRAKAKTTETNFPGGRSIPSLRWWICALLFVSTAINYIDRQTLPLLAAYLKQDYHWRNTVTLLFALATFSYATFTTIANVLPSDLKKTNPWRLSAASAVRGRPRHDDRFRIGGPSFRWAYRDGTHLFDPLMVIAGLIPFVG
jgi:hypothetical protein